MGTTGDGFLALFDGAARAVRCATAMVKAAADLDLAIRAGLHTGEVAIAGGTARGLAVHAAARVAALAGAGEILVSSTTHDLLDGSGLDLASRGEHELKGLAGARTVFAVEPSRRVAAPEPRTAGRMRDVRAGPPSRRAAEPPSRRAAEPPARGCPAAPARSRSPRTAP